jgi:hypothetical protein
MGGLRGMKKTERKPIVTDAGGEGGTSIVVRAIYIMMFGPA